MVDQHEITDLSIAPDAIPTVEYFLSHCVCVRLFSYGVRGSWTLEWANKLYDFDWAGPQPPTLIEAIRMMVEDSRRG